MEITFFHKNLSKEEEGAFVEYVEEKRQAIESLLTKFAEDSQLLKISVEKFEKHAAYQVEMNLTLPSKTIKASEASHHFTKAIDLSKDRLVQQIKKHIAHLRKDRQHQSIRTEEAPVTTEVSLEVEAEA